MQYSLDRLYARSLVSGHPVKTAEYHDNRLDQIGTTESLARQVSCIGACL